MSNHLAGLSNQLRGLADAMAKTEGRNLVDQPDSERLRAAAVVIERMPCAHESDALMIKGARVGRCRHCNTPLRVAWVIDEALDLGDPEPES